MSYEAPSIEELEAVRLMQAEIAQDKYEIPAGKYSDTTVLRFLRGMKGDSVKALHRLAAHHKWRMENDADNIENNMHKFQIEIDKRKIINGFIDLQGRPVSYCFAHRHVARDRKLEEMQMLTIWSLESTLRQSNPNEERILLCFYLGKFSLACMDYEVVKYFIDTLQSNYPDTLEHMFLIDAPFLFSACWAVIKRWIDPVTATKVKFIKKEELTAYLPQESIPSFD